MEIGLEAGDLLETRNGPEALLERALRLESRVHEASELRQVPSIRGEGVLALSKDVRIT